ncbi:SGNH/GDSL hydrolase family protein [Streptomyces sp. NPDC092296]|uniref:SGNH/GDSL hydrolase family protein n=1 Tax=Streptomyces sp. NPDC092296 TaxID=3366012 RepID=UPI003819C268
MRHSRTVSATVVVLLATLMALLNAPTANAATVNYVALGDSYSAGVGSGSYIGSSGDCKRSTKAYPYLWNAAHAPSSFTFAACSGAKTGDVLSGQLSALSSATTLVSISIGGNDAGFADVMTTCVLSSDTTCLNAVATARSYAVNTLPGKLDQVYAAIKAKAPAAHVVVLGYPHLYKIGGTCIIGIGDTKRSAINAAADDLAEVTAKRAADAGFTFVDMRPVFNGHEICSSSSWINSTTLPIDDSYHPNQTGQASGYLPSFSSHV